MIRFYTKKIASCPSLDTSSNSFEMKKVFCYMVDGGKELFDHRMNQLEKYKEITGKNIGKALQGEYGF